MTFHLCQCCSCDVAADSHVKHTNSMPACVPWQDCHSTGPADPQKTSSHTHQAFIHPCAAGKRGAIYATKVWYHRANCFIQVCMYMYATRGSSRQQLPKLSCGSRSPAMRECCALACHTSIPCFSNILACVLINQYTVCPHKRRA